MDKLPLVKVPKPEIPRLYLDPHKQRDYEEMYQEAWNAGISAFKKKVKKVLIENRQYRPRKNKKRLRFKHVEGFGDGTDHLLGEDFRVYAITKNPKSKTFLPHFSIKNCEKYVKQGIFKKF